MDPHQPTRSYKDVRYDLRPAKQVERRMILETFIMMSGHGFRISSDYTYVGFGSIYYVDFILFHKYLAMDKMISVEWSDKDDSRVEFNKPFDEIDLRIAPVSEIIPELDRDKKYIVWLDFDYHLNDQILTDIGDTVSRLAPGSIFLVTVDIEPKRFVDRESGFRVKGDPESWRVYFESFAENYLGKYGRGEPISRSNYPDVNREVVKNLISRKLSRRPSCNFIPLFDFRYADGHEMMTVGGVIGTNEHQRNIEACDFKEYIRRDLGSRPYYIKVPALTRKEKAHLEKNMPCNYQWTPDRFELSPLEVRYFDEIYRYYPNYAEMLY